MDAVLVESILDRDWPSLVRVCRALAIGTPEREAETIYIPCRPTGTDDEYLAVLGCDGYDAQAPLLDFANPEARSEVGNTWWPNVANAPYNSVSLGPREVPILCVTGTRGYHLHPSHRSEQYERSTWHLTASATLLHRLLHAWVPYLGRGR